MFAVIYMLIWGHMLLYVWGKKNDNFQNFQNFIYKIHGKLWGDGHHQLTHLIHFHIFISTVREIFCWKLWQFKIYIKFSLFCSKLFTLYFELTLNLDRNSPLTHTRTGFIFTKDCKSLFHHVRDDCATYFLNDSFNVQLAQKTTVMHGGKWENKNNLYDVLVKHCQFAWINSGFSIIKELAWLNAWT